MGQRDGTFRVVVKESARKASKRLNQRFAEGELLTFPSRESAESYAAALSPETETALQIQAAAPQDASPADGYLIAHTARTPDTPINEDGDSYEFPVSGNLYGKLGEAIVCERTENPPLLTHYLTAKLTDAGISGPLNVEVETEPDDVIATIDGERTRWQPDCTATVTRNDVTIETYACEIKTGSGSVQRDQRAVMEIYARHHPVLLIRIDLSDLPVTYGARISEITPSEDRSGELVGSYRGTLSEFIDE